MQAPNHSEAGKYQPGKQGLARIFHTLIDSSDGLCSAWRHEAAFRQLLALQAA